MFGCTPTDRRQTLAQTKVSGKRKKLAQRRTARVPHKCGAHHKIWPEGPLGCSCHYVPKPLNFNTARRFSAAPEAVASSIVLGTVASLIILPLVLGAVL